MLLLTSAGCIRFIESSPPAEASGDYGTRERRYAHHDMIEGQSGKASLASASSSRRLDTVARTVLLAGLTALLVRAAWCSLSWSYIHDFPLLHYAAWLFGTQGAIPYQDLFEFNMPGTYLLHLGMGAGFGWDPNGIRWFDLTWLVATLAAVAWVLARFGRWAAWGGAIAVGLGYLGHGPATTLQREWLLVLPLLLATAVSLREGPRSILRTILIGKIGGRKG